MPENMWISFGKVNIAICNMSRYSAYIMGVEAKKGDPRIPITLDKGFAICMTAQRNPQFNLHGQGATIWDLGEVGGPNGAEEKMYLFVEDGMNVYTQVRFSGFEDPILPEHIKEQIADASCGRIVTEKFIVHFWPILPEVPTSSLQS